MTTLRKITADEGFVFKLKGSDQILGSVMYLGKEDSVDRYEQVPASQTESETNNTETVEENDET